jgi:hypothetical protein
VFNTEADSMTPILLCLAILAVVFVGILVARRNRAAAEEQLPVARRNRAAFEERFPPISDAEFLARCSPGVDPAVALKVRRIVADYFDIDYERVHPSMRFVDDLGA